jgi:hypothetical protein
MASLHAGAKMLCKVFSIGIYLSLEIVAVAIAT